MDKKKKFVILLSVLIGIAFLYVGFNGMKQKEAAAEAVAADEAAMNQPADENSADALDNLGE